MYQLLEQFASLSRTMRGGLLGMFLVEMLILATVVLVWPRWFRQRNHGRLVEALGYFALVVTSIATGLLVFFVSGSTLFDDIIDRYGAGITLVLIILLAAYQVMAVAPDRWQRARQGLLALIAPLFVFFAIMAGTILGRILI